MHRREFIARASASVVALVLPKTAFSQDAVTNEDDLFDLREQASKIVDRTIQRIARARSEGNARPVMLGVGESHGNVACQVTKMLVVKELKERGVSFAVGHETPNDTMFNIFSAIVSGSLQKDVSKNSEVKNYVQNKDIELNGVPSLKATILDWTYDSANLSQKTLSHLLLSLKISSRFNDAVRQEGVIVKNDPTNMLYIDEDASDMDLFSISQSGVYIRNQVMAHNAKLHAENSNVDLYIQFCGGAHLIGGEDVYSYLGYDLPFAKSYIGMLKGEGYPVIAVDVEDSNVAMDFKVMRENLEDYELISDVIVPDFYHTMGSDAWERVGLEKTLIASGLDKVLQEFDNSFEGYIHDGSKLVTEWATDLGLYVPPSPK